MAQLILHFLGPFRAALNNKPLDVFDSNKVRALLAYLVMERNRPHSREVLAGMLWPEQSQRSAMDNLRYALADLRKVLGDAAEDHHFLIVSREMIQFDPASNFWLDVTVFEEISGCKPGLAYELSSLPVQKLEEAIQRYQGSFLEGFNVSSSAPFEEWMSNQREQLHRRFLNDLSILADYYERLGELEPALQAARRQVELDPWQEEAQQQLIRLLAFDGKRSAALQQYEICKSALASELGVAPSDKTTDLYKSIRDGSFYIPFHIIKPHLSPEEFRPKGSSSPFFAREEELMRLSQSMKESLGREKIGQVIFITGEAGSGKTTLVKEFINRSMQQFTGLAAVYTNCNAFTGTSDPYLPFIEILSMLTGDVDQSWIMGSGDRDIAARLWAVAPEAVQALIEIGPDLIGRLVAGEELLARARVLPHTQTQRLEKILQKSQPHFLQTLPGSGSVREREISLFEQVLGVLKRITHQHAIILAIDDLQWADPDTLNLLFFLCRRLAGCRLMILGIYREEDLVGDIRDKPSPLLSVLHELQSNPGCQQMNLSQSDGSRFIQCLVDSEANLLGKAFRETLEQVTSGIPLFCIELLRSMRERGAVRQNECGQWVEASELNWDQLPPRIEAVIAEQVNRMPAEWQNVLATASVEGDDFTAETVAGVLSLDPRDLVQLLSGPISKNHRMIVATGVQPIGGKEGHLSYYRFRHHLFQKYFYFRQDIVERTQQHEAVGEVLQTLYGEETSEYAITLAHHFEKGERWEKAAAYLLQAGKNAVTLFANDIAIMHFHKGLELLNTAPHTPGRDHLELSLLIALGGPLINTQGYTSTELEQVFARARKLLKTVEGDPDSFWILSFLKSYYNIRGDPINSQRIAAQILKMAYRWKDTGLLLTAHSRMVSNCLYYVQWASLQKHIKQAIQLYDPEQHRWIHHQIGSSPITNALSFAALGTWIMGYPDRARNYCQSALELAQELEHPMVSWFAEYYALYFFSYTGEIPCAKECIEKALFICDEQNLAYYRIFSQALYGWVMARAGDIAGIGRLEQGTGWLRQMGDRMNLLTFLRLQADVCLEHNRLSQALTVVDEALALSKETQFGYEHPELMRLKGEILLAQFPDKHTMAREWFLTAVESARIHKSKMWELRAEASLARLSRTSSEKAEAYTRLKEIYNWFTEGLNTADLLRARDLLEKLAC